MFNIVSPASVKLPPDTLPVVDIVLVPKALNNDSTFELLYVAGIPLANAMLPRIKSPVTLPLALIVVALITLAPVIFPLGPEVLKILAITLPVALILPGAFKLPVASNVQLYVGDPFVVLNCACTITCCPSTVALPLLPSPNPPLTITFPPSSV